MINDQSSTIDNPEKLLQSRSSPERTSYSVGSSQYATLTISKVELRDSAR